jgi:exodeoxyribonuclease VII large subunit
LKHLNPELVLERGYAIVLDAKGAVVRDAGKLAAGDELALNFARGSARAEVKSTKWSG